MPSAECWVNPANQLDSFGLNHLSWTRTAYVDGQDILASVWDDAGSLESILYQHGLVETLIQPEWLETLRMIPGWYLRYFYDPQQVLEQDRAKNQTRGTDDMQAEVRLKEIFESDGYTSEARRILSNKGGAQYYMPVLQVIDAMLQDRGDIGPDTTNGIVCLTCRGAWWRFPHASTASGEPCRLVVCRLPFAAWCKRLRCTNSCHQAALTGSHQAALPP
jgi:hypothetical protein